MYQEEIAKLTADHLRSHIKSYLDAINLEYAADKRVKLIVPKTIEVASVVGGMMKDFDQILPAFGIDILNIVAAEDPSSLWTHEYDGQINGLVSASSQDIADRLVKRYAKAAERFVRSHLLLHQTTSSQTLFTIIGFGSGNMEFSGGEDLGEFENKQVWLSAFSLNVFWLVSEDGPGQHEN